MLGKANSSRALLSALAQRRKCRYFLDCIPKDAKVLEIGCGCKWVGQYLLGGGWRHYVGLDLVPPADIVGDVKDWRDLPLVPGSFDAIVAFEVIEHVDCIRECFDLLKPGGRLMMTSPLPHMDWAMKILEAAGLNQKRTSPHDHLVYFRDVPLFELEQYKVPGGLSQWGIFRKPRGVNSIGQY